MFSAHKSKIGYKTQPNCETCQAKQTPEYYLLHWGKYEKKKMEVLFKTIYKKMSQNIQYSQYIQRTNQKKQK